MMLKKLFVTLLITMSCTTLNKNMVKEGKYDITGGVFENLRWEDTLTFKRVSWFKELTLTFDIFMVNIGKESPFYSWFSKDEKQVVESCLDSKVMLTYAWDPMQISREGFYSEVEKLGYERISIPNFHGHVKMHPNFARINVYLYKTSLICRRKIGDSKLVISFPGFNSVTL